MNTLREQVAETLMGIPAEELELLFADVALTNMTATLHQEALCDVMLHPLLTLFLYLCLLVLPGRFSMLDG